ncbi:MAG: Chemotaxis response regulator protein-glutamate methylesterase [Turneriella sp.]|nr:Chemotaxis response regulator protein-glutamate methylesterase [Turneriella sp.]
MEQYIPQTIPLTRFIAIGSSTGGPQALESILQHLNKSTLPIVITQHMPENFTLAFANRLNETTPIAVKEAEDGDILKRGQTYIAPGGKQLRVKRHKADFFIQLSDDAPVNRHKPSVDVLFDSVIAAAPNAALGILLTGMGNDGAQGLLRMRERGYTTIAQDEASSVVWGMPREAVKIGAVEEKNILPLGSIAPAILAFTAGS